RPAQRGLGRPRLVRRRPRAVRAGRDGGRCAPDVPGLAGVHPGRPLRRGSGAWAAGLRDGRGLQRARRVGLGRAGPAPGREPAARPVALRALAEPGPLPRRRVDMGGRPATGAAPLRGLLRRLPAGDRAARRPPGAHMTERLAPEVEARLDQVATFAGRPRTVEVLTGGLTNLNLKVTTPEGCYVARLSNDHGDLLAIDREAEYRNSLAAAESGMAPAVVDYVPGRGVLVVAWVEGRTYEPADVREPANLPRLADACRVLHAGPTFVNDFDMFRIHRG